MMGFLSKFIQDNFFSLYFYFSSGLTQEFYLLMFVNIVFVFYFLLCLYLLNLVSYLRNNFFENSQLAAFLRDAILYHPYDDKFKTYATTIVFYFYNFLTVVELLIKSSFIVALGFLSFKFPFVELNSNPLLSLKFSNFFAKSRFYSYRPTFFRSPDSFSNFSSNQLSSSGLESPSSTFGYTRDKISSHREFMIDGRHYRQRIRPNLPNSPIFEGDRFFLFKKLSPGAQTPGDLIVRYIIYCLRAPKFTGYKATRRFLSRIGFPKPILEDFKSSIKQGLSYQNRFGIIRPKSLNYRKLRRENFLYFRPEDLDTEVPRGKGFISRLFLPGGRSKIILHVLPVTPPHERDIELYYFRPRRAVLDNDMWPYQLEEHMKPPYPDDPIIFSRFMKFSELIPDVERIIENLRIADRPRIVKDFRVGHKEQVELHNQIVQKYPELGTPFKPALGSRLRSKYDTTTRYIKRVAEPELYENQLNETEDQYVWSYSNRRFRSYYRVAITRPFPKEEAMFDSVSVLGLPWSAHYIRKPVVKFSEDDIVEPTRFDAVAQVPPIRELNFSKGYNHFVSRKLFDFISIRVLKFLRANSAFKHRRIKAFSTLNSSHRPLRTPNDEMLVFNSFERPDYREFLLYKKHEPDKAVYWDRDRPLWPLISLPTELAARAGDGTEYPYISVKPGVSDIQGDSFSLKNAHSKRFLLNKQSFIFNGPGPSFNSRISRNNARWAEMERTVNNPFSRDGVNDLRRDGSELRTFGLVWYGPVPRLLKKIWQFILDQTVYLSISVLARINSLDQVSQYAKPSSATSHGKEMHLNYYVFKFRTLYFFRRLFRDLFLRSPIDNIGRVNRTYSSNSSAETESFTLFLIESVAKGIFNKFMFLLSLFMINLVSVSFSTLSEMFFLHPTFFLVCGAVILMVFWRVVYPFEREFRLLRLLKVDPFQGLKDVYGRVEKFFKYVLAQFGFISNIFLDGNFTRKAGEPSYEFSRRFEQSFIAMYTAAGFFERKLNYIVTKLGYKKELYDRTMFKIYGRASSLRRRRRSIRLVRKLPFIIKIVIRKMRPIRDGFVSKLRSLQSAAVERIKKKIRLDGLKLRNFYSKYSKLTKLKSSDYIYSFRNWLNR